MERTRHTDRRSITRRVAAAAVVALVVTTGLAIVPTAAADHWAQDRCSVDHELNEVGGTNIQYVTGHTDGDDADVWKADGKGNRFRVAIQSDDGDGDIDEEFNVRLRYRQDDGDCVVRQHVTANGPTAVVTLRDSDFRGGSDAAWISVSCTDARDGCSGYYAIEADNLVL